LRNRNCHVHRKRPRTAGARSTNVRFHSFAAGRALILRIVIYAISISAEPMMRAHRDVSAPIGSCHDRGRSRDRHHEPQTSPASTWCAKPRPLEPGEPARAQRADSRARCKGVYGAGAGIAYLEAGMIASMSSWDDEEVLRRWMHERGALAGLQNISWSARNSSRDRAHGF